MYWINFSSFLWSVSILTAEVIINNIIVIINENINILSPIPLGLFLLVIKSGNRIEKSIKKREKYSFSY